MHLHVHKEDTDMLDLRAVANEFVNHNNYQFKSPDCIWPMELLFHLYITFTFEHSHNLSASPRAPLLPGEFVRTTNK